MKVDSGVCMMPWKAVIAVSLVCGFVIVGILWDLCRREDRRQGKFREQTRFRMCDIALGCSTYYQFYAVWPPSITDLTNNPAGLVVLHPEYGREVLDGWGRPLVLEPFRADRGYGCVLSAGADGILGGCGSNDDWEARFPCSSTHVYRATLRSGGGGPRAMGVGP